MIDTETTGLDLKTDAVVEVAAVPMVQLTDNDTGAASWVVLPGASSLVAPGRHVPPEARAVHHLSDEQLRSAPKLPRALSTVLVDIDQEGEICEALVAHNALFDRSFVGQYFPPNIPWLDTCRLAMHLWPDAPAYGNLTLFYWLNLDMSGTALAPHRALYDAMVTAHILQRMLQTHSTTELLELQDRPVLQRTCRFGKHRGALWSDVPRDYLRWIVNQDNPPFDDDVVHTCRHWMGY